MEQPNMARKRTEGKRSRAGCLTCRNRHMRCDEEKPCCQNCLISKRSCTYLFAGQPIRDRRLQGRRPLLPGQQIPWLAGSNFMIAPQQLSRDAALDPFDVFPILMPYKSKELFHYFHQVGNSGEVELEGRAIDCLTSSTTDQHALRSTLLIAGLHHSWNTGNLQTFQAAFLFHKLESIRNINNWLDYANYETVRLCVRQICTLCMSEVCLGNVAAGDAHLDGLLNFMDEMEKQNLISVTAEDIDTELTNRYIILTCNFVHLLKSRLNDFILFRDEVAASPVWDEFSHHALDLMHEWHKIEHRGLENRLKALRMLPHFFCPIPPARQPRQINASPMIESFRLITDGVDRRKRENNSRHNNQVWNEGGPNQLFVDYVYGHISSFSENDNTTPYSLLREKDRQKLLPSSWSGLAAIGGLYMHSVLNVANVEEPIDHRLIRRLAMIAKRDVDQTIDDMRGSHGRNLQDFWFWKTFITALALAINQRDLQNEKSAWPVDSEEATWDLRSILNYTKCKIRAWSVITGTKYWSEAKCALVRCIWPTIWSIDEENFAEALWYQAVNMMRRD